MNTIMKKFSQELTKKYTTLNQKLIKNFSTSLVTKMNRNRKGISQFNHIINPSSLSIYSKISRGFFSSDSKNNKEKTEEEEAKKTSKTEEEKSKTKTEDKKKTEKKVEESSDEEQSTKEQLKELKKMYDDQLKASETLKKKFEDLRKAYVENVQETEQIKVRYDREIALTKDYAITKFSKDILEVCDNFDRALNSINGIEFDKLTEQEKVDTHKVFLEGNSI
jgi:molecular chaperone GrpE (heat shock protein)